MRGRLGYSHAFHSLAAEHEWNDTPSVTAIKPTLFCFFWNASHSARSSSRVFSRSPSCRRRSSAEPRLYVLHTAADLFKRYTRAQRVSYTS